MSRCVNSDHIHFETYRDTLLELAPTFNSGNAITRKFYDEEMSGRQNPELVASILPEFNFEKRRNIWERKEERYEAVITRGVKPIAGLVQLLSFLSHAGIKTYVVTNAPVFACHLTMESIGIKSHFEDRVICAEECTHAKPHPAPYLRGLELAGVSADEAIAFEDSPSGTTSATAAGLLTVGMTSTQTDEVLCRAGAAFTVADYEAVELLDAIKSWIE